MAIEGSKRPDFARKVGVATFEVVAINPDAAKIKELFKLDEEPKEPDYFSEKDIEVPDHLEDGAVVKVTKTIKTARVDFYLEDTKTQGVVKKSFFLQNRPFVKKDLSKQQYINVQGKTAWVDDPANLPAKFTKLTDKSGNVLASISYHPAIMGESDLVGFLDTWLTLDKKKAYELSVDTDQFFKGNFRELQGLVNSDLTSLIMGTYTVKSVEAEGGVQFYQDLWKEFLPAFAIKFFQATDFTAEKLKEIEDKDRSLSTKITNKETINSSDWLANWEKYVLSITDSEYGCGDFYSLKPAHDFDPATHFTARAATIDATSSEY